MEALLLNTVWYYFLLIKHFFFLVIACKPAYPPYLSALLPQDQIFDPEDLDSDPKSQIMQQQKDHDTATKKIKKEIKEDIEELEESPNDSLKSNEDSAMNVNFIDNPYLAATKLPAGQQMDTSWKLLLANNTFRF